ncbi:putative (+)-neomenthol dehydrogenase [Helianthus anomalus]
MEEHLQVTDENVDNLTGIFEEPYAMGKKCLDINYYGTKRVTLFPLLQLSKSPRIVNVTSAYGEMRWFHNERLKQEFLDIENLTEARIDEIVQWFLRDLKDAKLREN